MAKMIECIDCGAIEANPYGKANKVRCRSCQDNHERDLKNERNRRYRQRNGQSVNRKIITGGSQERRRKFIRKWQSLGLPLEDTP